MRKLSLLLLSLLLCLPVMGQVRQISSAPTTTFQAGTASAKYPPTLIYQRMPPSATGVGNTATTSDVALWTLTPLPAGTLAANGDSLVLQLHIGSASNGNNKRYGVTVGGTTYNVNTVTNNGSRGILNCVIRRVDATHVAVALNGLLGLTVIGSAGDSNAVVSDLTTNTLAVVVVGASPTTGAANDALLYGGVAELK